MDIVTESDRRSEALIVARLREQFPDHAIVAEEGGGGAQRARNIAGTWTRSTAPRISRTAIRASPCRSGCWRMASRSSASCSIRSATSCSPRRAAKARISTASAFTFPPVETLAHSLVATGFPTHQRKRSANMDYYWEFTLRSHGVRRDGSAALDLCSVAVRTLRAFWEFGLNSWDTAAGMLLVQEAGGNGHRSRGQAVSSRRPAHARVERPHPRRDAGSRCRASPSAPRRTPDGTGGAMNVSDFDYDLPPEQIAQRPLAKARRFAHAASRPRPRGAWDDRLFREFPDLLRGDELIVVNNARVLPARLFGRRAGIHASRPAATIPRATNFCKRRSKCCWCGKSAPDMWETLVRPGQKNAGRRTNCFRRRRTRSARRRARRVRPARAAVHLEGRISRKRWRGLGHIPLPPYIKRAGRAARPRALPNGVRARGKRRRGAHGGPAFHAARFWGGCATAESKSRRSRSTWAWARSSRCAPSAWKTTRFTPRLTKFRKPRRKRSSEHSARTAPCSPSGTTVVRALEDAAEKNAGRRAPVAAGKAEARIFFYPGKPFRIVNQLLTNFHLPQSSLLALVAAFAGRENVLRAYRHAVESGYRFYSYGDCDADPLRRR